MEKAVRSGVLPVGLVGIICAAVISFGSAEAQQTAVSADAASTGSAAPFSVLVGQWVRPDGGYRITINSVGADGKIDASYANPAVLPFSRTEAMLVDDQIRVFFELTAGGYGGSTYTLTYDADSDTLRGIYYQANARQRFDIYFERAG